MPKDLTKKDFDMFIKYLITTLVNIIKLALNIGLFTEKEDLVIHCDTGEELTISYSKPDITIREESGWHLDH